VVHRRDPSDDHALDLVTGQRVHQRQRVKPQPGSASTAPGDPVLLARDEHP